MKKTEKRMVKVKNNASHSAAERMTNEGTDSKNNHQPAATSENHTQLAEKPWNPCDFYYY